MLYTRTHTHTYICMCLHIFLYICKWNVKIRFSLCHRNFLSFSRCFCNLYNFLTSSSLLLLLSFLLYAGWLFFFSFLLYYFVVVFIYFFLSFFFSKRFYAFVSLSYKAKNCNINLCANVEQQKGHMTWTGGARRGRRFAVAGAPQRYEMTKVEMKSKNNNWIKNQAKRKVSSIYRIFMYR